VTAKQRRTMIWAVVAVLVACFLGLSVISQLGDIQDFEWHFSPGWLAASLVLLLLFQFLQIALWTALVRMTGGELPLGASVRIYSISLLTRYVPTQVLMAVTRVSMLAARGVSRSIAAASLAYEIPLAVGASFALSVAFLIDLPELKDHEWRWFVLLAPVALLSLLHPRVVDAIESRLSARLKVESEHLTLPVTRLIPFVIGYVASFVIAGLGVYAFARSVYPAAHLDLRVVTSYAIGYSAAVLAFFIPGGLGARDGATATALAAVMPSQVAIATAVGIRLAQTLIELGYAATAELLHRRRARPRRSARPKAMSGR
jgi:hypothetical protein